MLLSSASRWHAIRLAYLLAALAVVAPALADNGYINIEIVNNGVNDQRVAVVDKICQDLVLEKRVIAHGILPAQVCAREMGRGDITIRNLETGDERRHAGILDGARVQTP